MPNTPAADSFKCPNKPCKTVTSCCFPLSWETNGRKLMHRGWSEENILENRWKIEDFDARKETVNCVYVRSASLFSCWWINRENPEKNENFCLKFLSSVYLLHPATPCRIVAKRILWSTLGLGEKKGEKVLMGKSFTWNSPNCFSIVALFVHFMSDGDDEDPLLLLGLERLQRLCYELTRSDFKCWMMKNWDFFKVYWPSILNIFFDVEKFWTWDFKNFIFFEIFKNSEPKMIKNVEIWK